MHNEIAVRSPQHRIETSRGLGRGHPFAHDFVGTSRECGGECFVVLAGYDNARDNACIRIPLEPAERVENRGLLAAGVERDNTRPTPKRQRHEFVPVLYADDGHSQSRQPAAKCLRQLATAW
jgi:hypothetical protein